METLQGEKALQKRLAAISDTRMMLGQIGLLAVAEAKKIVPHQTRNLARTIRIGTVTKEYVEVLAGGRNHVGYARFVEFGTKPHIIRPRRAKALAWGGGRTLGGRLRAGQRPTHFAKMVRHPGTKAQPYLVPGIRAALKRAGIKAKIVDAWNRAA